MNTILLLGCLSLASVLDAAGVATTQRRVPIILDTDIGQDFDDTWALSYLLTARQGQIPQRTISKESSLPPPLRGDDLLFDVKMVLSAYANTTGRAFLVAKFLQQVGRTEIDVGVGLASTNTGLYHGVGEQMHWVPDSFSPSRDFNGSFYYDGLSRVKELLENGASEEEPWIVLCIAPMTNMGQLFSQHPHLKKRVVFVTMGGSIFHGYGGGPRDGEHNIVTNLTASQAVYNSTKTIPFAGPICAAPLDTTDWFQIYGSNYEGFRSQAKGQPNSSVASTLLENFEVWNDHGGCYPGKRPCDPKSSSSILYDCQAAFQAAVVASTKASSTSWAKVGCLDIPWMITTELPIVVGENGMTEPWFGGSSAQTEGAVNPASSVAETISWEDGQWNGTWALGAHVVSTIVQN